jgi:hypothetical protein
MLRPSGGIPSQNSGLLQCFFAARKPSCGKPWIVVDLSANLAVFARVFAGGKAANGKDGSKQREVGR